MPGIKFFTVGDLKYSKHKNISKYFAFLHLFIIKRRAAVSLRELFLCAFKQIISLLIVINNITFKSFLKTLRHKIKFVYQTGTESKYESDECS